MNGYGWRQVAEDGDRILRWAAMGAILTGVLAIVGVASIGYLALRLVGLI